MATLSRKNKIAIAATVTIAIILGITIPYVGAQTAANNSISNLKTLSAKGYVYQAFDSNTIKYYPANLTLSLQPTTINGTVRMFDVAGGTVVANGISYTITSGTGGYLTVRHVVLLQAQGTGPDGQSVTLKLAGQYSYSWLAHRLVFKIGAKLQTDDSNYTLLMRASART